MVQNKNQSERAKGRPSGSETREREEARGERNRVSETLVRSNRTGNSQRDKKKRDLSASEALKAAKLRAKLVN